MKLCLRTKSQLWLGRRGCTAGWCTCYRPDLEVRARKIICRLAKWQGDKGWHTWVYPGVSRPHDSSGSFWVTAAGRGKIWTTEVGISEKEKDIFGSLSSDPFICAGNKSTPYLYIIWEHVRHLSLGSTITGHNVRLDDGVYLCWSPCCREIDGEGNPKPRANLRGGRPIIPATAGTWVDSEFPSAVF